MKFGLMYEIQIPEPHYPGIVKDTYNQVMAQVILAEEMGFEHFWTVEHHFLTEFSYCPAPEVLYGAVSQRTSKIRIGHAVALLPPQYNHPIRVAERAAVLDILSDGRVDLGTGRSTTLIEMGGFGIDPEDTRPMWEEALSMIPRMWLEEPFSHEGHYFKIPPRSIIPKPIQQPHPPLWMACSQPDSFSIAGQKGIGALCFNIGQPEELERRVQLYRDGIRHAQPVGAFINNQVAALGLIHCAETDKRAREIGGPAGMWMLNKSLELYRPWQEQIRGRRGAGRADRPLTRRPDRRWIVLYGQSRDLHSNPEEVRSGRSGSGVVLHAVRGNCSSAHHGFDPAVRKIRDSVLPALKFSR